MLFAGYLEALCQNYSVDCLLFSTSVSRTNPALESFVVDHTQVPILKYRMAGSLGCDHACRSVHTDLMMAMDHLPHESAWRGTRYEEQLIAQGAHPRQFQCNQSRAASRRARSAIGSDHAPSVSGEWQLGPYSITPYDVSIFRWNWFDLQFRTREEPPEQGFHLAYDGVSYTRDEIHALAMTICTLLDIEPVEFDEN